MTDSPDQEALSPNLLLEVDRGPHLKARFEAVEVGTPLLGSSEWNDRATGWGGDFPSHFGSSRIMAAADHLVAWRAMLIDGKCLPVFAQYTLLRPVFECSVQARWVLDHSQSPTVRIGRSLGMRLEDLRGRDVIEKDFANWPAWTRPGRLAADIRPEIIAKAEAHGVKPIVVLDTASLMSKYAVVLSPPDVVFYRLTSAVVHGEGWIHSIGDTETLSQGATMGTHRLTGNQTMTTILTRAAADHLEAAVRELAAYVALPDRPTG